jgi:transcriptional regulator with XRE-family HTH domain
MGKPLDPQPTLGSRLAARVEALLNARRWKRSAFAHGKVSANTVRRILHGKNARLSTLIALADALDCDLIIDIKPRPESDPQHIAHER